MSAAIAAYLTSSASGGKRIREFDFPTARAEDGARRRVLFNSPVVEGQGRDIPCQRRVLGVGSGRKKVDWIAHDPRHWRIAWRAGDANFDAERPLCGGNRLTQLPCCCLQRTTVAKEHDLRGFWREDPRNEAHRRARPPLTSHRDRRSTICLGMEIEHAVGRDGVNLGVDAADADRTEKHPRIGGGITRPRTVQLDAKAEGREAREIARNARDVRVQAIFGAAPDAAVRVQACESDHRTDAR